MQKRIRLLSIAFLCVFVIVVARLFYWQVIKAKDLADQARRQYQTGVQIKALRGNILASDGSWLAGRGEAWLVYAEVPRLDDPAQKVANKLAPHFVDGDEEERELLITQEKQRITSVLSKEKAVWVPLKTKLSKDVKEKVDQEKIKGIGFERQEIRTYPEASAAAQLLGFVGKDEEGKDKGYFGLEGYYDMVLSGKPGFLSREADAKGMPILFGDSQEVSAIGGVDLVTHLVKPIQLSIERELPLAVKRYGAKAATAVVMDPKTGAILGMGSYPSFDPLNYSEYGDAYFRNPIVSDSFEPGSIFKVLVMAAGLDSKVISPDTTCNICNGPLQVDKYFIQTWNKQYHPDSSMTDVIANSDNVGMSFVAQRMGADRLYDYLDAFGLGKLTGVDLQGEMTPKLRSKGSWNVVDTVTASFGQGIAVTPIQMIRAVGAIANSGLLMTPQVVDKLKGEGWEQDIKPVEESRVISARAADEITSMMIEAVKRAEMRWTTLNGFKVAGKTGTAQIPIAGHYDKDKTIASFVAFAPHDDPEFVMLVTVVEPSSSPWAEGTAAPLWYLIAKDIFYYFGIQGQN